MHCCATRGDPGLRCQPCVQRHTVQVCSNGTPLTWDSARQCLIALLGGAGAGIGRVSFPMPDSDFDFELGVNLDPCTQQAADAYTKVANVRRRVLISENFDKSVPCGHGVVTGCCGAVWCGASA